MRLLYLYVMIFLGCTQLFAEPRYAELLSETQSLLKDIANKGQYKRVSSFHEKVGKGSLQEKVLAIGLLGARLHKDLKGYQFFEKLLRSHYGSGEYSSFLDVATLSESCSKCDGTKKNSAKCLPCKGTGDCKNYKCKEGKTVGFEFVDGKSIQVEKPCTTCSGTGYCGQCKGEAELLVNCSSCRATGVRYSSKIVKGFYQKTLNDLVDDIGVIEQTLADDEKISKGMVKVDGVWYTKEQISRMEKDAIEAQRLADLAEQRAMASVHENELERKATLLLASVEKTVFQQPSGAISSLQKFQVSYPDYKNKATLESRLSFCKLIEEALALEKKGAMSKAIRVYEKALKLNPSQYLSEKIQKLDNETIGL